MSVFESMGMGGRKKKRGPKKTKRRGGKKTARKTKRGKKKH